MRKIDTVRIILIFAALSLCRFLRGMLRAIRRPVAIVVDGKRSFTPFPHFWEEMFGSGRAILSLRDNYRQDLRDVKRVTDFEYVRFHAILHDEVGVYDEDAQGHAVYNFSYVDQIYDGLLANGVKPFVEVSFMPQKLAARNMLHVFWYKAEHFSAKRLAKWDDLVSAFTKHLIERYGIDEVAQWYFRKFGTNLIWISGGGDPKASQLLGTLRSHRTGDQRT